MTRFLVILALLVLVGLAIDRGIDRVLAKLRGGSTAHQSPGAPQTPVTETLVRCARCGVHVPEARTTRDNQGQVVCSERCRTG